MADRWCTTPRWSMIALNPVGAACSIQRPLSTARRVDEAICWVCTWFNQ